MSIIREKVNIDTKSVFVHNVPQTAGTDKPICTKIQVSQFSYPELLNPLTRWFKCFLLVNQMEDTL